MLQYIVQRFVTERALADVVTDVLAKFLDRKQMWYLHTVSCSDTIRKTQQSPHRVSLLHCTSQLVWKNAEKILVAQSRS